MLNAEDRRRALLYVAGRFMMVHIDRCGRQRETRAKRQAASIKPQAASNKQDSSSDQAASHKVRHRGAWIKFRAALLVGLDQDVRVGWVLHMEGYLVR